MIVTIDKTPDYISKVKKNLAVNMCVQGVPEGDEFVHVNALEGGEAILYYAPAKIKSIIDKLIHMAYMDESDVRIDCLAVVKDSESYITGVYAKGPALAAIIAMFLDLDSITGAPEEVRGLARFISNSLFDNKYKAGLLKVDLGSKGVYYFITGGKAIIGRASAIATRKNCVVEILEYAYVDSIEDVKAIRLANQEYALKPKAKSKNMTYFYEGATLSKGADNVIKV